jgi:hypothetical protein
MIYFYHIESQNYFSSLWERLSSRDQHCGIAVKSRLAPPENSGMQAKAAPTTFTLPTWIN